MFAAPQPLKQGQERMLQRRFGNCRVLGLMEHRRAEPRAMAALPLVPVRHLNPFLTRCRIQVRVVTKTGVREYGRGNAGGRIFSVDLMDAEGVKTRAAVFNAAVDRLFPRLLVGQCYEISSVRAKQANRNFCEYAHELTLDNNTTITVLVNDSSIPQVTLNFMAIAEIEELNAGDSCDVAGVIVEAEQAEIVDTRWGKRSKRNVLLVDASKTSIVVSLWGEKASFELPPQTIIFCRNARVSLYNGRSLEVNEKSFMEVDPTHHHARQLRAWYTGAGRLEEHRSMTAVQDRGKKRNLAEAFALDASLREDVRSDSKRPQPAHIHNVVATVVGVETGQPLYYLACTFEVMDGERFRICSKKVENGHCRAGHPCNEPEARYILAMRLADCFRCIDCRAFHEEATTMIGIEAEQLATPRWRQRSR